jgi:hypothetical protein
MACVLKIFRQRLQNQTGLNWERLDHDKLYIGS